MANFKRFLISTLSVLVVLFILYFVATNWGFVFSKTIEGEIVAVERVTPPVAIVNNGAGGSQPAPGMFSFAVAVRSPEGVIHTASSEDRQWAVARAGNCVKATFFPYAPWVLKKDGTYYNARLDELRDCASKAPVAPPAAEAPTAAAPPSAVATPADSSAPQPAGTPNP